MKNNDYTYEIIGKAMEVHRILGPGLLESTYQECLLYELEELGYDVRKELYLEKAYRIDLLINEKTVIEIKAVEKILPVHRAQLLTYMKLGGYKIGLLINFNTRSLTEGIKRFVM